MNERLKIKQSNMYKLWKNTFIHPYYPQKIVYYPRTKGYGSKVRSFHRPGSRAIKITISEYMSAITKWYPKEFNTYGGI